MLHPSMKMIVPNRNGFSYFAGLMMVFSVFAQSNFAQSVVSISEVDSAWANNSVNTTIFRKNALVTFKDTQFISYYNPQGFVVVGKRKLNEKKWILRQTSFKGNVRDAHNSISMMVDGDGFVHLAWDHHNNLLHYAKSKFPCSLLFDDAKMTGLNEMRVSYPEFYKLNDGDLLFFYRNGGSGRGNLVINRYYHQTKIWKQLQQNLIDGEGKRSAYWQAFADNKGLIHISWVWRESPDVSSNHDMCYAYSDDGCITWKKSSGEKYLLPINALTAEYVCRIPQQSELINQTSMYADTANNIFIATYYRELNNKIPQYHIICKRGNNWKVVNTKFRTTAFSLSGNGTKKIPIARPQIISWTEDKRFTLGLIYRDEERANAVTLATYRDIENDTWQLQDIYKENIGSSEPCFDTELWKTQRVLNLFVLKTTQVDGEGKANLPPELVKVVEWKP